MQVNNVCLHSRSGLLVLLLLLALSIDLGGVGSTQKLATAHTLDSCESVLVLFADQRWLPLAKELRDEWERVGVSGSNDGCWLLHEWSTKENLRNESSAAHYFGAIGERMPVVLNLLRELPRNNGRGVLMLDADIALRRNVGAWAARASANATLVVQQEWPCQTWPHQRCVNGGAWWIRRTDAGVELLASTVRLMQLLNLPDQDALQIVAARQPHSVHYWSRRTHPNGWCAQRSHSLAGAHLVHANWLGSFECKRRALASLRENSSTPIRLEAACRPKART